MLFTFCFNTNLKDRRSIYLYFSNLKNLGSLKTEALKSSASGPNSKLLPTSFINWHRSTASTLKMQFYHRFFSQTNSLETRNQSWEFYFVPQLSSFSMRIFVQLFAVNSKFSKIYTFLQYSKPSKPLSMSDRSLSDAMAKTIESFR